MPHHPLQNLTSLSRRRGIPEVECVAIMDKVAGLVAHANIRLIGITDSVDAQAEIQPIATPSGTPTFGF